MMKILKIIKIDYRDRKIIRDIHKYHKKSIRIKKGRREAAIRKGMGQGCNFSPLLFDLCIKQFIKERKEYCPGNKMNGMRIQTLRFADDIVINTQEEINIKRALGNLDDILKSNYKIKINRKKTEVTFRYKNSENINTEMDEDVLKQVPKFKYLGSIFAEEGKNKEDNKMN